MPSFAQEVISVPLESELKQSFLDYAMSVIGGRALPDVRDGLKPVHRRVLFAMHELGNDWNKAYKKSARVVGDVLAKYHPHGDAAVYDTIVRMAQSFSMRYLLIDGQGNFGSVDGDPAAAFRYTEIRMAKFAHALLADLEKQTVDFEPNYDGTEKVPTVLPTKIPNLLVNGASGIAVGMATNIPPHNLTEVINACLLLLQEPHCSVEDLIQVLPAPDFPTGGIICGTEGIAEAYRTGRGRLHLRGLVNVEEREHGGESVVITQLPYQVNKARLVERIAELVRDKKLDGITDLRDESDREGMRVVIELRRGESAAVLINQLYLYTQLEVVYGMNMVALVNGSPKLLDLKSILEGFLSHRREVVTRRIRFEWRKAKQRLHILEGLLIALQNLDEAIALIKASASPQLAKEALLARSWTRTVSDQDTSVIHCSLSPEQAQAILDLRLHRLTALEQNKIFEENAELNANIQEYEKILNSAEELKLVIIAELKAVQAEFGDARLTQLMHIRSELVTEDLIPREEMVVTLSYTGYAKAQPVAWYEAQHRGGRGKSAASVKEEDSIQQLVVANSHDTLLCFSSKGKVYWLKVYDLPRVGRQSQGKPLINSLMLSSDETITRLLPIQDFSQLAFIVMVTRQGIIKKVSLADFARPRQNGIIAVDLDEADALVAADLVRPGTDLLLLSSKGKLIRFSEAQIRPMGRGARGIIGIRLPQDAVLVSLLVIDPSQPGEIVVASAHGYGKRTRVSQFSEQNRGGQGVTAIPITDRNGAAIGAIWLPEPVVNQEVLLISDKGTLVRIRAAEISCVSRTANGVKLIQLAAGDVLCGLQAIADDWADPLETQTESSPEEVATPEPMADGE